MNMLNWVAQYVNTTGTAPFSLGAVAQGSISFNKLTPNERFFYVCDDGDNRETGIGFYDIGQHKVIRETIIATLIDNVYSDDGTTAPMFVREGSLLYLSGTAESTTTHKPTYTNTDAILSANPNSSAVSPDFMEWRPGINLWSFPKEEESTLNFVMPQVFTNAKVMSEIMPYIKIMTSDNAVGTVRFSIDIAVMSGGKTSDAVPALVVTATVGTVNKVTITEVPNGGLKVPEGDGTIIGSITRLVTSGGDTFAKNIYLVGLSMNILTDKIGTPGTHANMYEWR